VAELLHPVMRSLTCTFCDIPARASHGSMLKRGDTLEWPEDCTTKGLRFWRVLVLCVLQLCTPLEHHYSESRSKDGRSSRRHQLSIAQLHSLTCIPVPALGGTSCYSTNVSQLGSTRKCGVTAGCAIGRCHHMWCFAHAAVCGIEAA
jgi:hypothetical protein